MDFSHTSCLIHEIIAYNALYGSDLDKTFWITFEYTE